MIDKGLRRVGALSPRRSEKGENEGIICPLYSADTSGPYSFETIAPINNYNVQNA